MKPQCEKTLNYMKEHGSITPMDALNDYGCFRLASRIADLKRAGYLIRSEKVKVRTRDGSEVYVAQYSLIGGEDNG